MEKSQHRRNPNFWLQCISAHLLTLCELLSGNQVLPGQQWSSLANNRQQTTNDTTEEEEESPPSTYITHFFHELLLYLWIRDDMHDFHMKPSRERLMNWCETRTEEIETTASKIRGIIEQPKLLWTNSSCLLYFRFLKGAKLCCNYSLANPWPSLNEAVTWNGFHFTGTFWRLICRDFFCLLNGAGTISCAVQKAG